MRCRQRPPPAVLIAALQRAKTHTWGSRAARTGAIQGLMAVCVLVLRMRLQPSASVSARPADPHIVPPAPRQSSSSTSFPLPSTCGSTRTPSFPALPPQAGHNCAQQHPSPCTCPCASRILRPRLAFLCAHHIKITHSPHIPIHLNRGLPASNALCRGIRAGKTRAGVEPPLSPSLLSPAALPICSLSALERPQPGRAR